jgi:hypothetical protein
VVPPGQRALQQPGASAASSGAVAAKTITSAQLDQLETQLRTAGKPRSRAQIEQTFRNEGYTIK